MPSQVTNVPLVRVYDYLKAQTGPSGGNANPISSRTVTLTLAPATTQASSINPVTQLPSVPIQSSVADGNGYWEAWVVPTDNINPSGMTYLVDDGYRTYKINPIAAGIPANGWQSSAIVVSTPQSVVGVGGNLLPGGTTVLGGFTTQGLLTAAAGEVIAGGTGATLNASGDFAGRSITLSGGSGPYTPKAPAGGAVFQSQDPWFDVLAYGAKGDGVTDDTTAIQNAASAANTAGGGIVWFPSTVTSIYAISGRIPLYNQVKYVGAEAGIAIKWIGAAPGSDTAMIGSVAVSGSFTDRPGIANLRLDAASVNHVIPLILDSVRSGTFSAVELFNANGASGQFALKMIVTAGTNSNNNTTFNKFYALRISSCQKGIQLSGQTNGSTNNFVTGNYFYGCDIDGVIDTGIEFVGWCDTNYWDGFSIGSAGNAISSWTGVVTNTGVPASDNGVHQEVFNYGSISNNAGGAGQAAFRFNKGGHIFASAIFSGIGVGSVLGNFIVTANGGSSSYYIQRSDDGNSLGYSTTFTLGYQQLQSTQTITETTLVSGVDARFGIICLPLTLTANRVVGAPLNALAGQILTFIFVQAAGNFSITWNAVFKTNWSMPAGGAGRTAVVSFIFDGTNWQEMSPIGTDDGGNALISGNVNIANGNLSVGQWISVSQQVICNADLRRSHQAPSEATLVSGVSATGGELVNVTLSAARIVGSPLNAVNGQRLSFVLIQGGAGNFAVTWNAIFKGITGGTSGATGTRATFSFNYDGTNWNLDGAQPTWV